MTDQDCFRLISTPLPDQTRTERQANSDDGEMKIWVTLGYSCG
jgi:hypothetical protein